MEETEEGKTAQSEPMSNLTTSLSLPDNQGKLFDHYISVLAATMSDTEEPLQSTPIDEVPVSEIGEPLPAPLSTVKQGEEMDVIWRIVHMVTPTKGTNSTQLKQYWAEFVARYRHYQRPLDESRTLLVICHITANHLTRNYSPKDIVLGREEVFGVDGASYW
jgi:hypothetical protein